MMFDEKWGWWFHVIKDVTMSLLWCIPKILQALLSCFLPRRYRDIRGQTVLVTGAAQGLGRELALEFSRSGCTVICVDIASEGNQATASVIRESGHEAHAHTCDVTDRDAVFELARKVPRVDILVNNAGIIPTASLLDATPEQLRKIMDVNTISHFWTLQAFLPAMLDRNRGHVVSIASMGGLLGIANSVTYSTSKFAVVGLMAALYEELRELKSNVKLTCVCPYFTRTIKEIDSHCHLRIPAIESNHAARDVVRGVRQKLCFFSVPRYFMIPSRLIWLLPQEMQDTFRDIFYCKVTVPKNTEMKTHNEELSPIYKEKSK